MRPYVQHHLTLRSGPQDRVSKGGPHAEPRHPRLRRPRHAGAAAGAAGDLLAAAPDPAAAAPGTLSRHPPADRTGAERADADEDAVVAAAAAAAARHLPDPRRGAAAPEPAGRAA